MLNQKNQSLIISVIFIIELIINLKFLSLMLSIFTSIILLVTSIVGIIRYTNAEIENSMQIGKSLIITSSIVLILSIIWMLFNFFLLFVEQLIK